MPEPKDANTEAAPSAVPEDAKTQTPAPSAEGAPKATSEGQTLADVVQEVFKASQAEEPEEGARQELATTEAKDTKEPSKAGEQKTEEPKKLEDEETPPFHEHPAWQRVVKERNDARGELDKLKPLAEGQRELLDYCAQKRITEDQFKDALRIVSLINSDPAQAYEQLKPLVAELQKHVGEQLPADLQAKVTEGVLDPETAREVARLRAEKSFNAASQQTREQQQAAAVRQSMVQSLDAWDAQKTQSDPSFKELYPMIRGRFLDLRNEQDRYGRPVNPILSPSDAVALAERAYADVKALIGKFVPAPHKTRPALTSNGSATVEPKERPPKTVEEAALRAFRKHVGS